MILLKVPFSEKDQAKALGARWNADRKAWYVPDGQNASAFERWLDPSQEVGTLGKAIGALKTKPAGKVDSYIGKQIVGAHYVELKHDCKPFEACAECQPALQTSGWVAAHIVVEAKLSELRLAR
ncbi:hypothetical protein H7U20_29620 [Rugamonas sp. CCM 8940]|nr:DUF5710 domain-containing protein [Rugamonas sp. CCM 8940]MBJ7314316.1 hypothetical protein [Rugamonas sp. CCM 8940]